MPRPFSVIQFNYGGRAQFLREYGNKLHEYMYADSNCGLRVHGFPVLTNISLAYFLWDIGKQDSPRCDSAKLGLFCLLSSIN